MVKKLYQNEQWLRYQLHNLAKKPEEVAKLVGVDPSTIYRTMKKFNIR